jgi:hypothetical protein
MKHNKCNKERHTTLHADTCNPMGGLAERYNETIIQSFIYISVYLVDDSVYYKVHHGCRMEINIYMGEISR